MIKGGVAASGLLALGIGDALAQQGPGVTDKEIKLGSWMPLTGPIAAYGVPHRAGIESYLNMVNDRGGIKGRKFSLVVEDNAMNPQRTVAAARKLVSRDDVLAIAVPFGTAQSTAAFEYLFGEVKVPLVNPYGGAADWYSPVKENLFGALVLYENQARAIGRWAAKDGHKNIVVVHSAINAFENVAINVAPGAKSVRPDVAVELYSTKLMTIDYGPAAVELAKKKPDAGDRGGRQGVAPARLQGNLVCLRAGSCEFNTGTRRCGSGRSQVGVLHRAGHLRHPGREGIPRRPG